MIRAGTSAALAALLTVAAVVGLGPVAQADAKPRFTLTVDHRVLHAGEQLAARAEAETRCQWVLEWNGERRVTAGRSSTPSYTAPMVTRPTRIPVHAVCFYDVAGSQRSARPAAPSSAALGGASQRLTVTVPPSWRDAVVVTVLPPGAAVSAPGGGHGHGGGTSLPNTGGPALLPLLAALSAVLVGAAMVRSSRRLAI